MNKVIDRTEEKISLAKELGLDNVAKAICNLEEEKQEIRALTSLGLKEITEKQIRRKLCSKLYLANLGCLVWESILVLAALGFSYWAYAVNGKCGDYSFTGIVFFAFLFGTTGAAFLMLSLIDDSFPAPFRFPKLSSMPLRNWQENMPYGALLAIKEAKGRGLGDMWIYFPITAERFGREQRLKSDPVIVAHKAGKLFEIFAWDDGKVYE